MSTITTLKETESEIDTGYICITNTHKQTEDGKLIYHIGKTNDIDEHLNELDNEESSYRKNTIVHVYHVNRPIMIEEEIHKILDHVRVNPDKSGFYAEYVEENIKLIESMIALFRVK